MAILRPFGVVLAIDLAVHAVAWACLCASAGDPVDRYVAHDLVVYAEVVETDVRRGCLIASSSDPVDVHLDVIEGFKGAERGDPIVVQTASSDMSCGTAFGVGERWLVYADGGVTGLCSGNRRVGPDDPELQTLRMLRR